MNAQRPSLIFIAGLNNNDEALRFLAEELRARGFTCHLLNIPGQGLDRSETESFERATAVFDRSLSELATLPYSVIAFSTGALYFNLWLADNPDKAPVCEVLLAPAFKIRNAKILKRFFSFFPGKFSIRSLAPAKFRRYNWMKFSEYQLLFRLISEFDMKKNPLPSKVHMFVDARDELVDAQALAKSFSGRVSVIRRPVGKIVPGMFHALFHPDFWAKDEWKKFVDQIVEHLE